MATKKTKRASEPKYHHGDLRRALVEGALQLIAEAGPQNLSLREVARRIGVTTAAPYHHFKDREALLLEIGIHGYRLLLQVLESARGEHKTARQELEAEARSYLTFARQHPALYAVMFSDEVANREDYPELRSTAEGCFRVVCGSVASCAGLDDRESAEAGLCAWAMLHGLSALDQSNFLEEAQAEQDRIAVRGVLGIVSGFRER